LGAGTQKREEAATFRHKLRRSNEPSFAGEK